MSKLFRSERSRRTRVTVDLSMIKHLAVHLHSVRASHPRSISFFARLTLIGLLINLSFARQTKERERERKEFHCHLTSHIDRHGERAVHTSLSLISFLLNICKTIITEENHQTSQRDRSWLVDWREGEKKRERKNDDDDERNWLRNDIIDCHKKRDESCINFHIIPKHWSNFHRQHSRLI